MTKRLHHTLEVLEDVLSDDGDLHDPDEPMMEGSDDEFSDLEVDEDEDDNDDAKDTIGVQGLSIDTPLSNTISLLKTGHRSTDPTISSISQHLRVDSPTSPRHSLSHHSSPDPPTSPGHSFSQHSSPDLPTSPGHSLSALKSRLSHLSQALQSRPSHVDRVQILSLLPPLELLSAQPANKLQVTCQFII